jgi:hypothetical protein
VTGFARSLRVTQAIVILFNFSCPAGRYKYPASGNT